MTDKERLDKIQNIIEIHIGAYRELQEDLQGNRRLAVWPRYCAEVLEDLLAEVKTIRRN